MQTIDRPARKENLMPLQIEIRPLKPGEDATPFRLLNEEWITRFFVLEAKDVATLGDPQRSILDKGGQIFLADAGDEVVGCVALIPVQDGMYELSKMAVAPKMQGQGIGRRLLEYTVARARELGAKSLFLGSQTRLANAVHLYEAMGFRHVSPDSLPDMHYSRADVFMKLDL